MHLFKHCNQFSGTLMHWHDWPWARKREGEGEGRLILVELAQKALGTSGKFPSFQVQFTTILWAPLVDYIQRVQSIASNCTPRIFWAPERSLSKLLTIVCSGSSVTHWADHASNASVFDPRGLSQIWAVKQTLNLWISSGMIEVNFCGNILSVWIISVAQGLLMWGGDLVWILELQWIQCGFESIDSVNTVFIEFFSSIFARFSFLLRPNGKM